MYDQWLFKVLIFFLSISCCSLAIAFAMSIGRSARVYSRCFFKTLAFLLTIFSCLLLMAIVMSLVGCVMMGLYVIGSLLITAHVDGLTALYVALDTAFVLGGGLAVITALLCYSDIYDYFNHHACNYMGSELLTKIAIDPLEHSIIDIKKNHLLSDSTKEKFDCPICFESMIPDKKHDTQKPITLRDSNNGNEQTYHEQCLLEWMKDGLGANDQDPIMRVNFSDPRLFRYTGYKKTLRKAFRENDEGKTSQMK